MDGLSLVFAGWSDRPLGGYIDRDGTYRDVTRADGMTTEEILLSDPYPVPAEDRTLYAVYAADENGEGRPDYMENAVHVEYYANGGTSAAGGWLNGTEELFYICAHRHAPGETEEQVLTVEQGTAYISRPGALLVGWSTSPAGLCLTRAQVTAALIGTARLPARGEGNLKLYAVWAADENENGIPDYQETAAGSVGKLEVTKTVKGRDGETAREWHFRVELSDTGLNGLYGDMLFVDGVAEFTLRHGQTATATELPAGLTYTVTEAEAGKDGYTTVSAGETGTIPEGDTARASFVNSRGGAPAVDHPQTGGSAQHNSHGSASADDTPKTGDDAHLGYWFALMCLSMAGFLIILERSVQKKHPRGAAPKHTRR